MLVTPQCIINFNYELITFIHCRLMFSFPAHFIMSTEEVDRPAWFAFIIMKEVYLNELLETINFLSSFLCAMACLTCIIFIAFVRLFCWCSCFSEEGYLYRVIFKWPKVCTIFHFLGDAWLTCTDGNFWVLGENKTCLWRQCYMSLLCFSFLIVRWRLKTKKLKKSKDT